MSVQRSRSPSSSEVRSRMWANPRRSFAAASARATRASSAAVTLRPLESTATTESSSRRRPFRKLTMGYSEDCARDPSGPGYQGSCDLGSRAGVKNRHESGRRPNCNACASAGSWQEARRALAGRDATRYGSGDCRVAGWSKTRSARVRIETWGQRLGEVRGCRAGRGKRRGASRSDPYDSELDGESDSGHRALDGNAETTSILVSAAIDPLESVVPRH